MSGNGLTPAEIELAAPAEWMSWTESEKAWMSIRDADLLEVLMLSHARRLGRPVDVLEWGSGRSTMFFSVLLQTRGLLGSWLTLEHNREFFLGELGPRFDLRPDRMYRLIDDSPEAAAAELGELLHTGAAGPDSESRGVRAPVVAAVFDGGELRPYDEQAHRDADLEDYVRLPALLGRRWDVIVIDGRKRRRCLIEAAGLLGEQGITVLHDGWREYYSCAFEEFAEGTHVGDELWIGAQLPADLRAMLPGHAFEEAEEG